MCAAEAAPFLPIWSCSVWGLPCPSHYWDGGALLPHLFTLTSALPLRRFVFCGTFRPSGLNLTSRTLSGTLLCGVRTFLLLHRSAGSGRPVRLPTTQLYMGATRVSPPLPGLLGFTFLHITKSRADRLKRSPSPGNWNLTPTDSYEYQ